MQPGVAHGMQCIGLRSRRSIPLGKLSVHQCYIFCMCTDPQQHRFPSPLRLLLRSNPAPCSLSLHSSVPIAQCFPHLATFPAIEDAVGPSRSSNVCLETQAHRYHCWKPQYEASEWRSRVPGDAQKLCSTAQVWKDAIDLSTKEVYFHYTNEIGFRNITATEQVLEAGRCNCLFFHSFFLAGLLQCRNQNQTKTLFGDDLVVAQQETPS